MTGRAEPSGDRPETLPGPEDVIAFWTEAGYERWFEKSDDFDAEIARRFAALHRAAVDGAVDHWMEDATSALALIIVLDQFSRNLHRGSADAYAADAKALKLAEEALERGYDQAHGPALRAFFYLPFMHAEDEAAQQRCVALYEAMGDESGLVYARDHADIIVRFGRFPHRNQVLGRATTPAEQAFLDAGGFAG